jgi:hypothetical protein
MGGVGKAVGETGGEGKVVGEGGGVGGAAGTVVVGMVGVADTTGTALVATGMVAATFTGATTGAAFGFPLNIQNATTASTINSRTTSKALIMM